MSHSRLDLPALGLSEVTVGADTFRYIDVGSGSPVVFLHGALGDLRTWRRHCEALSGEFRCISYTQRYFGTSPWREDGPAFGVRTHADDLIGFLRALDLGPVHVVAWSYAGHVALDAALRHPNLFGSLLLYEPGVRTLPLEPAASEEVNTDAQAAFGPIFEAVTRGDQAEAVRLLIDASGGQGYFDGQSPDRRVIHLENAHTMPLLLAQTPPPHLGGDELASLVVPVSVAWGEQTRPVFKRPAQALAHAIPHSRHMEVPGVGHLWPEASPMAFATWVGMSLDPKEKPGSHHLSRT